MLHWTSQIVTLYQVFYILLSTCTWNDDVLVLNGQGVVHVGTNEEVCRVLCVAACLDGLGEAEVLVVAYYHCLHLHNRNKNSWLPST